MKPPAAIRIALAATAFFALAKAALGGEALEWKSKTVELDAAIGQELVEAYFPFTNASNKEVTITSIQASCGCTVPSLEKKTYAPGESGKLLASFEIGGRVGPQSKEITVETKEADGEKSYSLILNVDIPQLVQLKRRALLWKIGEEPAPKDCAILIHASSPMTIEGVALQSGKEEEPSFSFEIVEIDAKREYLVRIIPKSTEARVRKTYVLVSSDDKENQLVNYPIYAWIR